MCRFQPIDQIHFPRREETEKFNSTIYVYVSHANESSSI